MKRASKQKQKQEKQDTRINLGRSFLHTPHTGYDQAMREAQRALLSSRCAQAMDAATIAVQRARGKQQIRKAEKLQSAAWRCWR